MASAYLEIDRKNTDSNVFIHENLKFHTQQFTWKVKFNTALDPRTVNATTMYITTINQTPVKTSIVYNSVENVIEITPAEQFNSNEPYYLNITKDVKSIAGKRLKHPVQIQFKVKNASDKQVN